MCEIVRLSPVLVTFDCQRTRRNFIKITSVAKIIFLHPFFINFAFKQVAKIEVTLVRPERNIVNTANITISNDFCHNIGQTPTELTATFSKNQILIPG